MAEVGTEREPGVWSDALGEMGTEVHDRILRTMS
jgi:hypothetical protein